ncbi:MAG: ABC transporter permease [Alphaproteobacteria bacterium]
MNFNEIILGIEMGLIYGIVAIGIYITFRIIDFPDLTCDGSFVLGGAVTSTLIKANCNPWVALIIAMVSGGIAGSVTGVLHAYFKVTDLLAGILVGFMLYSVNLYIMNNTPNIVLIQSKTIFEDFNIIMVVSIIAGLICILYNYLLITDFGLALRSVGQNKKLARNSGLNVQAFVIIGLILSNALIALSGAIFTQHQRFADVGSGVGTVIVGLASVMIGEKILPYRSIMVQLISCLLGSIIYRLLISFALHSEVLGLETQNLNLLTGIMVIMVMYMSRKRAC